MFLQLTRRSGCQGSGNAFRLGSADGSSPPWTGGNGTVVQCGGMLAFGLRSRSIRSLCEFKGVNDGALWPASADSGGAGTTAMRGRGVRDGCQREGCCGPKCQSEVGAQGSLWVSLSKASSGTLRESLKARWAWPDFATVGY